MQPIIKIKPTEIQHRGVIREVDRIQYNENSEMYDLRFSDTDDYSVCHKELDELPKSILKLL